MTDATETQTIDAFIEVYRTKAAELEAAVSDGDQTYAAYSEGYRDACLTFVEALSSIYAEAGESTP
ncbi:hypothetical protein [Nocardia spumae]|uniref:hypothetical protein n=1 Tax=Nocardia spumae TaxID=2887190 RepID=UPI001D15AE5E|nr:hypothetical protein [Nocardia spumae]